jgi:hypothetical protein
MTNRERQALIGGLVGVHLAVGPLLNYFGTSASPWESLLDSGILAGQVSVLGIWTVYGALPINRRIGFSLVGLAYIWYWMVRYWSFPASFALGAFGQWFLVVALLLAWQALRRSQTGAAALPRFGIKELLLWTTMGAATLAVAKWLGAESTSAVAKSGGGELLATAKQSAAHAVMGIAALWVASSTRRPLLKTIVLVAAAVGLATCPWEVIRQSLPLVAGGLLVVCTVVAMRWLRCFEPGPSLPRPAVEAHGLQNV